MLVITEDKSILITRGDIASIEVSATISDGDEFHSFNAGDIVRLQAFEKNRHDVIVLRKDIIIDSETTSVDISLETSDTRIGEVINKPKDYWYEVILNPDTRPQTLIGYDSNGPKIFRLYPEGVDLSANIS